jgi:type IV pilus assembly protein PilC
MRVLREVKQDVENGVTFSEALRKHSKIFPPLFISMVMAGETGGTLAKSLRQLADYMDKEQETKQKVKSALAYPKIVALVSALVIFALIGFIIPRFAQIYKQLGVTLPLITRILVGTSVVVSRFWWMLLLGGILIYVIYNRLKTVPAVKGVLDKISLNVPIFGSLNRKVLVSRFIRILSTLMPNGVPIMQSLNVVEEVVDNKVMDRVIDGIRTSISSGGGLNEPISASYIFPSMVVQMIGIGEETGRLGSLLEKSSVYLDREIDATIKSLITRIEPTMTIILAGVVAIIALSIYLPLFGIFEAL